MESEGNPQIDQETPQPNNLADAQKLRKQLAKDSQMLANRINLLKQEEIKTWKKIEETKKRAKDILDNKKRHEERQREKMRVQAARDKQLKETQQRVERLRKERASDRGAIRDAVAKQNKDKVVREKHQQRENNQRRQQQMESLYNEGAVKAESTRRSKAIAVSRVQNYHAKKQQETKAEYDRRMDEERSARQDLEREVMEMELLEMELIKKLQNTQQVQKQTFEELERAIRS